MDASPGFPWVFVYLLVATIPAVLVHELGHALVARQRLGEDVEVSIGNAGRIAEFRLGQISTTINILSDPTRPGGQALFPDTEATVRDVLWIALAGPLASLLGTVASALLYGAAPATGVLHDFLWASVGIGIFGVLLNLVPIFFQDRRDSPREPTDGRVALDALKVLRELR